MPSRRPDSTKISIESKMKHLARAFGRSVCEICQTPTASRTRTGSSRNSSESYPGSRCTRARSENARLRIRISLTSSEHDVWLEPGACGPSPTPARTSGDRFTLTWVCPTPRHRRVWGIPSPGYARGSRCQKIATKWPSNLLIGLRTCTGRVETLIGSMSRHLVE